MNDTRPVRTVEQVAVAAGVEHGRAQELLEELEDMGFAERCEGGWRMTRHAEQKYGRALRDLRV